jgi:hypothetical protein
MGFDTPATAEGDLARTPFAHLLVYAVDRRLTGALFLCEPSPMTGEPVEHVVRFARGAPVKVRPGDGFLRLGEMLIDAGELQPETLAEALATKGLLGDVLLLAGCVDRDRLEALCDTQFQRRMTRLFTLPVETTFRYCDGHPALLDYGSEPANMDPLAILWAGLRAHGGVREVVEATLGRLGDLPLRIHPQSTIARLSLSPDEARVVDHLRSQPEPLRPLAARNLVTRVKLSRLIYALAITRQLDLGASSPPVGAGAADEAPRSSSQAVGRVQLKPTPHRQGAAAPDAPGDGERAPQSRKSTTGPRRAILTPAATAKPKDLPPETMRQERVSEITLTASPQQQQSNEQPRPAPQPKVNASVRETLKSFGAGRTSENSRRISVEVIALDAASSAPEDEPAALPKRAPPPALRGLSASALVDVAGARLAARNLEGAEEACGWARQAEPNNLDVAALTTWLRAQRAGSDLKLLTVELDELLSLAPDHRNARYYRAMLRKRLGDNAGAIRDLQRLLDLTPPDAEAARALEGLLGPAEKPKSGLLGWLFKR